MGHSRLTTTMIYLHVSCETLSKIPSPLDLIQIITAKKQRLEVAHILRKHIGDYQNQYRLWPENKKIVSDLLNCRTAHLGGHIDR